MDFRLTFQHGQASWIQHSDETRHEKSYTGGELKALFNESEQDWKRLDDRYFQILFDRTRETALAAVSLEGARSDRHPILDAAAAGADRRAL